MWRVCLLCLLPALAGAETLVPKRTIRAQSIITAEDLAIAARDTPGALTRPDEAIGLEARVTLYANRPLRPDDLGPASIIDRNALVLLRYATGSLQIAAEGRALSRGGIGDVIRVMNLASKTSVSGQIRPDGSVAVGPNPNLIP